MRTALAWFASALAATAFGGVDVEAGNGDKITGTIAPATETETFHVRIPKGAAIQVKGKSAKGGPLLAVRLLDPAAGEAGAASGKAPSIRVTAAASGEFAVTVKSQDGTSSGDYALAISWKSRTAFAGTEELGPAGIANLPFSAEAGAEITMSVKAGKGSKAKPALQSVTRAGDAPVSLQGLASEFQTASGGDFTLAVTNTGTETGTVAASVKVKTAKPVKRKLDLTSAALGAGANGGAAFGKTVGTAGGTVSVPQLPGTDPGAAISGSSATIPAGALGVATAIVIGTAPPITQLGGKTAAGPTVSFGPDGLTFGANASVTIPYDSAFEAQSAEFVVYTRDAKGSVTVVPAPYTLDHGKHMITCATSHFSRFRVASPPVVVPTGNFNTIATIPGATDLCDGFDTGSQTNGVVQFFVAEGDSFTVSALRLKIPTGYARELWAGGGAQTTTPVLRTQFKFPRPVVSVSQDVSGFLFIATSTQIYGITMQTGLIDVYAGTGGIGDSGDGGSSLQATFTNITKIVAIQNKGLYVSDLGAHRVRFIDFAKNISAFAGAGAAGIGADGGALATTSFVGPTGIAAAPIVGIYVADGARIRWLSETGPQGPINVTVAGAVDGDPGSGGDGGAPLVARFQSIADIDRYTRPVGGTDDMLMVADEVDHTIRLVNLTTSTVTLIAGAHGSPGFNGDAGSSPGQLSGPNAVVGRSGRVYVVDLGNIKIREIRVE